MKHGHKVQDPLVIQGHIFATGVKQFRFQVGVASANQANTLLDERY